MTSKEILIKAIKKAKKNGYTDIGIPFAIAKRLSDKSMSDMVSSAMAIKFAPIIIFRHDFAKAFWNIEEDWMDEGECCSSCKKSHTALNLDIWHESPWIFHLQEMVLEEDPIKYLENFL